ncbi:MAG: glycosyltransferase [Candidatus Puniceispirillum sp.]|nr:glycosyltransferase [Candidatus Pelagibacter sp.]MBA4283460.1 glycosyltransferase [Candidatus Puniceispirillum sp.]
MLRFLTHKKNILIVFCLISNFNIWAKPISSDKQEIIKPLKIAVLYIATGRYINFWNEFYESSEKLFLEKHPKDYFVFTDQENFKYQKNTNVHPIHQKQLGWPYDTLLRFKMFLRIEERLKQYDYIFFFNANAKIIMPVGKEILPEGNLNLVVSVYPTYFEKDKASFPYERNSESTSYIAMNEGNKYYVQGGVNGGKSKHYLRLIKTCFENVNADLKNHIIATVHDESHINKYIQNRNDVIFLKPFYMFPEEQSVNDYNFKNPMPVKILIRDKNNPKYGGYSHLRGSQKKSLLDKIKCFIYKKFKFFFIDTLGLCHLESNKNCIPVLNLDDEKLFPKE